MIGSRKHMIGKGEQKTHDREGRSNMPLEY